MSLNERVRLSKAEEIRGPTGQVKKSWVQFANPWADAIAVSGRQYLQADAERSEITMQFIVRNAPYLRAGLRVTRNNGQAYDVVAPLPDRPRRGYTTLMTTTAKT